MIDALWSLEFSSNAGSLGTGIAVIEAGRLIGGDGSFVYVGTVCVENGYVLVKLTVTKYNDKAGLEPMFGPVNEFHVHASAPIDAQSMVFRGHAVEHPAVQMSAVAVRRAELPQG